MTIEEWKPVVGFEGIYEVSNEGRVRTCEGKTTTSVRHGVRTWKQRILKAKMNPDRYGRIDARIALYKDKKQYTYLVSRLVAMAWVEGYQEGLTVNHIDGNPLNNCSSNLEWVTRKRNIQIAFDDFLYSSQKPCCLLNEQGETATFRSLSRASEYLGRKAGYISNCLSRKRDITNIDGNKYTIVFCA